jgi:hypothetical protein
MFRVLLHSKPALQAYCKQQGISEEEAREDVFGGETDIPSSVFMNFNSDPEEERAKMGLAEGLLRFSIGYSGDPELMWDRFKACLKKSNI